MWKYTDVTTSDTIAWQSVNTDIEQLVSNDVVVPLSGKPVTAHWDRAAFYHDNVDTYPSQHAVTSRFNSAWDLA